METIIIIAIMVAFSLIVIKSLRSKTSKSEYVIKNNTPDIDIEPKYKKTSPEEMQAARKKKISSCPSKKIEKIEQTPSSAEGYLYYEMVGMYNIGIQPSDFGIYKGYAVAQLNNCYDKYAVGIYRKGDDKLVGYVPKEFQGKSNQVIHKEIAEKGGTVEAIFKIQGNEHRAYGSVYIKLKEEHPGTA